MTFRACTATNEIQTRSMDMLQSPTCAPAQAETTTPHGPNPIGAEPRLQQGGPALGGGIGVECGDWVTAYNDRHPEARAERASKDGPRAALTLRDAQVCGAIAPLSAPQDDGDSSRGRMPGASPRYSADVKNFVPSKNRFGRLNTEMKVAPFGAWATWILPPGRQTKSPGPQAPSASSSDPSSM